MKPDLPAIRARLEAATPGPWHWDWVDDLTVPPTKRLTTDSYTVEPAVCATSRFKQGHTDAVFIANAPTDIAALLDALEASEAEVQRLRDNQQFLDPLNDIIARREAEILRLRGLEEK